MVPVAQSHPLNRCDACSLIGEDPKQGEHIGALDSNSLLKAIESDGQRGSSL